MMTEQIEPVVLNNGVSIRFQDQSNRYFGDFHRVCVKVQVFLPESLELPDGIDSAAPCLEKTLEKMGVPGDDVAQQRRALIDGFLTASRQYLDGVDAPRRLLQFSVEKKRKPGFLRQF